MGKLTVRSEAILRAPVVMGAFLMPEKFTVVYTDSGDEPGYEMDFEVRNGSPQCRAVRITSAPHGGEVQRKHLRLLRLEDHLEYAVSRVAMVVRAVSEDGTVTAEDARDDAEISKIIRQSRNSRSEARRRISDDLHREVAEVYRANISDKPTRAVAEHFGKELRTASLYVKRARVAGFLGAAIKGKAGEQ